MAGPFQGRDIRQVGQSARGVEGRKKVGHFLPVIMQVAAARTLLSDELPCYQPEEVLANELLDDRIAGDDVTFDRIALRARKAA